MVPEHDGTLWVGDHHGTGERIEHGTKIQRPTSGGFRGRHAAARNIA